MTEKPDKKPAVKKLTEEEKREIRRRMVEEFQRKMRESLERN